MRLACRFGIGGCWAQRQSSRGRSVYLRKARITASSAAEHCLPRLLRPCREVGNRSPLLPLRDRLLVDAVALRQRPQALLFVADSPCANIAISSGRAALSPIVVELVSPEACAYTSRADGVFAYRNPDKFRLVSQLRKPSNCHCFDGRYPERYPLGPGDHFDCICIPASSKNASKGLLTTQSEENPFNCQQAPALFKPAPAMGNIRNGGSPLRLKIYQFGDQQLLERDLLIGPELP